MNSMKRDSARLQARLTGRTHKEAFIYAQFINEVKLVAFQFCPNKITSLTF